MPTRKLLSLAAVFALCAFGFTSQYARADEAAKKEDSKSKAKKEAASASGGTAKAGEACKVDADCDQSGRPMLCGRSKCEYDVSKIPVKT